MRYATAILFFISLIVSCSPRVQVRTASQEDVQLLPRSPDLPKTSPCNNPLAYIEHPELIRMKYIRVNFHFMNSTDGRHCFPEEEASQYAQEWVETANYNLANNQKMNLPIGNETPVLQIPYRYAISPDPFVPGDDGVYYHVDDELCYVVKTGKDRNISDRRVIKKYAVRDDSVLNIFVQSHHLDSLQSKTYKADASGISLGSSVKIFGKWQNRPDRWGLRGITNHEIGHSLGLAHTWPGHDGCDDTPPHPNCWYISESPGCDSAFSNNMMDYNASMAAVSPCQIGKVLMNMTRMGSTQRNILEPRWCMLDTNATITIRDSVRWSGSADLEGNIILSENAVLEIACRVSMPANSSITIHPGAKLVVLTNGKIHNSCGDQWNGIILIQEKKRTGQIMLMEGSLIEDVEMPLRAIR